MQHNTKLLATVSLAAAMLLTCAVSGCHRHNHRGYEMVEPTCTEDGYVKYWCTDCGEQLDDSYILPASGHRFGEDGYCNICGAPDLSNPAFSSVDDGLNLNLTAQGVLSWNRIATASKYELSITYSGETQPTVFTFEKTTATVTLDDIVKANQYDYNTVFPAGKCSAKFTPYTIYKETVNGEVIEQEYPISELEDEFKIIKLNGNFEIVRMTYADENITLNGFYSDAKKDGDGNEYYLYELLLKDNKATQFYIKNYVKLASGCTAQYFKTAQDRSTGTNAISDMDLRFMYINAGGNNVFYARVYFDEGGSKDYDLHIYGLQTLRLQRYIVTAGEGGNTYSQVGSDVTYTEGDIVPAEALFAGVSYNYAYDEKDNRITGDLLLTAPDYGDTVKIYFR